MDIESYLADLRARQEPLRPADAPGEVVYPLGQVTLPEYVAGWAERAPDRRAIAFEGRGISYAELDLVHRRVAGWLADAGVRPGDRVGVHLPNCPEFTIAFLAILRLGAVHVPVNPMFTSGELAHELGDSGARTLVTSAALLDAVRGAWEQLDIGHVLLVGEAPREAEAPSGSGSSSGPDPSFGSSPGPARVTPWSEAEAYAPRHACARDLDALAALNYTGGTTGMPKGCEHTQRHMLYTAASGAAASGLKADDGWVGICYLPVFWIAGEDLGVLIPLVLGGTVVLMERWDATAVLRAIDTHGATLMVGTVENYLALLDHPDLARYDLSTLTSPQAVSFVRKLTPEVRERWREAVGSGVLRESAYGMTETNTMDTSPYGFQTDDQDLLAEPVFCGLPVPGTDIAVVSFETGEPLPLGEVGEIIVRSPAVTTGYWNNPEATAAQLTDGWIHTGDNGRLDERGCLHYLGRDKEMIKVKGMSVFPAEVELILAQHPYVDTAAVVPADDPERGQRPVAFVSLHPGAGPELDAAALREWAAAHMAAYKVPLVRLVDDFPMTATGKIRKHLLSPTAQDVARGAARGAARDATRGAPAAGT